MAQRSMRPVATVPVSVSCGTCFPTNFRRAAKVNIVEVSGSLLATSRWFSFSDLRIATDNFHPSRVLDNDNLDFTVYKGILASGEEVRVTRVRRPDDGLQIQQFQRELEVLSRVKHLNLVSLVGFCKEGREKLLVYEDLGNGTLSDHLHDSRKSPLPFSKRLEIALGVARGVAHLHNQKSPPLVHRNIKSSSILLSQKLVPKVSEVGLSKQMSSDSTRNSRGTSGYLPPEHYSTGTFTDKSDVYAFGVVLLEILTAKRSFDRQRHYNHEKVLLVDLTRSAVKKGGWKAVEKLLDPVIRNQGLSQEQEYVLNLALYCTEEDLDNRPTMKDVVVILESLMLFRKSQCQS